MIDRITTFLIFIFLSPVFISAQDIVKWSFFIEDAGNGEVNLIAKANIEEGWYMYDTKIPDGGPTPTQIEFDKITGAEAVGEFASADKKATIKHDDIFGMDIGIFKSSAKFAQRLKITDKGSFKVEGIVRAQACNDQTCTPPLPVEFSFDASKLPASVTVAKNNAANEGTQPAAQNATDAAQGAAGTTGITSNTTEGTPDASENDTDGANATGNLPALQNVDSDLLWSPVVDELNAYGSEDNNEASLWSIFLKGILWGFAALLTPCVWPMIPITVSFFLNRNKKSRKKAIQDAMVFGLSIIIIYVALGLVITTVFGAAALNNIATSPVFNLIFFALLITFAFSFMGAFEIVLPSSWTNKMDSKVDNTTGIISLFFMAFTLALVSFSCTGPIIGWLLVDAAMHGNYLAPALGMFGFAFALAIPFTLFAIFPSWLKTLPKSGSWLNSVKVVLGFIVLAVSLKFLSVADLSSGWGLLNRDIFLTLWIVIFGLLGFYLLGKIKLHGDSDLTHVPLLRLLLAIASFAFTIYLVPGLWGAPLKPISSIVPPMATQDFKLADKPMTQVFNDYETGMAHAIQTSKPVFLEFGGFGCVNCHKMDATVLADERVRALIEDEFVFIALMVDDRTKLPEAIEVNENGRISKLRTVGDKWSYLQRHKFGTQSQPFYVVIDHQGKPLSPSHAFDESVDNFIQFLQTGLKNFKK